jgi:hypothetical protein
MEHVGIAPPKNPKTDKLKWEQISGLLKPLAKTSTPLWNIIHTLFDNVDPLKNSATFMAPIVGMNKKWNQVKIPDD